MKRKVIALMLGLVMTVSTVTGCGNDAEVSKNTESQTSETKQSEVVTSETTSESEEIAVDHFAGTTLDIVAVRKTGDTSADFNDKEIIKLVEEATGIHVNWTILDSTTAAEKISVMLMSDDKPDAYLGVVNANTLNSNQELFYDLSEEGLLEKWAPNVVADYNSVDGAWDTITWGDGSIRGLLTGTLVATPIDWAGSLLAINQEWLDKLGKPVPTTADELYDVLVAFRDNDMDGDGNKTNEIPMSFCSGIAEGDLMLHAYAFGIGGNYTYAPANVYKNIENGKVVSVVDTDNFRAFLEFYHKLAEEGLLDLEGFSQTKDQYLAKRTEKITGVFTTWNTHLDEEYIPFIYQGIEGVEPRLTGLVNRFTGQRSNFLISADSENVEAVLHWWNYMSSSPELKATAFRSSAGFKIDADGKVWNVATQNQEDVIDALGNLCPALTPADFPALSEENMTAKQIARVDFIEENRDLLNQEGFPVAYSDADKEEERAFMEVELFEYIKTFIADSIKNGVTDDSWAKHLEELKTVQYYDWLGWYQDFVDDVASR